MGMRSSMVVVLLVLLAQSTNRLVLAQDAARQPFFGIHVVDEHTERGVPLIELETVNHLRFVTDSAGWIAFHEPGLMGEPVFFEVRSHGYQYAKDGFGFAGLVLTPQAGQESVIRVQRTNIAQRLYRITGEGIYRDSMLLGKPIPLIHPLGTGKVAGQDSAMAAPLSRQDLLVLGRYKPDAVSTGPLLDVGRDLAAAGCGRSGSQPGNRARLFRRRRWLQSADGPLGSGIGTHLDRRGLRVARSAREVTTGVPLCPYEELG